MPEAPEPAKLPVQLRVESDLARSRLTVFFRLLLAIPHFIWFWLWGIFAVLGAVVNWIAVLIRGQSPAGLHRFLSAYVNYATHVYAYISVATRRFPGFVGDPGYEVDAVVDPPARQNRWTVLFRGVLAFPALLIGSTLSVTNQGGYGTANAFGVGGPAVVAWWYSLFRGRAPEGTTRLMWYQLHYGAQLGSYMLVLTDRYPNSDPEVLGVPRTPPEHPIALRIGDDSLHRSRLTVFFRLLLATPHFVWYELWAILISVLAFVNWLVTLVMGRTPAPLHNFFARFMRYSVHLQAYVLLIANPFPGFVGAPGSYPVDLDIAPPARQGRWGVGFRLLLVLPTFFIAFTLSFALYSVAFLGWFAALFTGRMPRGLRNLGAFCLRYMTQVSAYGYLLLTSRYPYAGPPAG